MNFDTGAAVANGGDMLWNGTTLTPQGTAKAFFLGTGTSTYGAVTQGLAQAFASSYSSAAIPAGDLTDGGVIVIKTNGGNFAKILVSSNTGGALTFQFTTFGVTVTPTGPSITSILNNYSFIPAGLPNSGIAQGSIFVIVGVNLSSVATPTLQSSTGGLPQTLNQTSLSVTVNGTTTVPSIYYASATAVAGVLPSTTPTGAGTLTLTFNGQATDAPIQVVQSALGLDTSYGVGTGAGIVEDTNFHFLGFSNPAKPGQPVILWGSGVGPDSANDDRNFPQSANDLTNLPLTVYVGGVAATVLYRGRSQYPGLDQIAITLPQTLPLGCFVPVVAKQGSVLSNTITMSVSQDGSPCSDFDLGYDAVTLEILAAKTNINSGVLIASQDTEATGTVVTGANASFLRYPAGQFGSGYGLVSEGACVVIPPAPSGGIFPATGLQAGTLTATTSAGAVAMPPVQAVPGFYDAALPSAAISSGGTISFAGTVGKDVGAFSTSVNLQNPLVWTNRGDLSSIDRTVGATVTWTGGFPNSNVVVTGLASAVVNGVSLNLSFTCRAPASAGQLVIPPFVTLALPAVIGNLSVTNSTAPVSFSATGLDYATAFGSVQFEAAVTYK